MIHPGFTASLCIKDTRKFKAGAIYTTAHTNLGAFMYSNKQHLAPICNIFYSVEEYHEHFVPMPEEN